METYLPVAGLTIQEAISRAKEKAIRGNIIIRTIINDIDLYITKDTNIKNCLAFYRCLLDRKHRGILKQR